MKWHNVISQEISEHWLSDLGHYQFTTHECSILDHYDRKLYDLMHHKSPERVVIIQVRISKVHVKFKENRSKVTFVAEM